MAFGVVSGALFGREGYCSPARMFEDCQDPPEGGPLIPQFWAKPMFFATYIQ